MKPPMVSSDPQLPLSNPKLGWVFPLFFQPKKKSGFLQVFPTSNSEIAGSGYLCIFLGQRRLCVWIAELPVQSSHQWATSLYRNPGQKVRCKYNVPKAINHPYFVVYTTHKNGKFGDSRGWFILLLYPAITCASPGFKSATTPPDDPFRSLACEIMLYIPAIFSGYHRWAETKSWIPEDFPTNSRIPSGKLT